MSGDAKMRSRCWYVVVSSIGDASDPQPCRAFHTIAGSAPSAASRAAIQIRRSHAGCFQIAHRIAGSTIGTSCVLCQRASPTTSPKEATRIFVGRSTIRRVTSSRSPVYSVPLA